MASDRSGDGLEQYTESDSSDRPGDAIESGMRETVAHPGIDGTWHHYGNIEWWEPDQLYDSDYARPICPVKHCASGRDHECRTICTRINPDEQLKPEFVETDNPVSGGWFCTHHGWFRIHNYARETESETEQATLLADGGQSTEGVQRLLPVDTIRRTDRTNDLPPRKPARPDTTPTTNPSDTTASRTVRYASTLMSLKSGSLTEK